MGMESDINTRLVTLEFRMSVNDELDARILRIASLLPGFSIQDEGRLGRLHMILADAGIYRDVLFDLWKLVRDRTGTAFMLDDARITLSDFKDRLAYLDRVAMGETAPINPTPVFDGKQTPSHNATSRLQGAAPTELDEGRRVIPYTTYADVGGLDEAVRTLRETVELPLKHPEILRRLGISPHRGVLLYGPPGCGKTLLARAVAHESGARFFPVSGPELITKWHGESEENLRKLFADAQKQQPSIVFFDEIDAVAQSRSSDESLRYDTRFTTQLLTLLDGIHDLGQVFVLATTNRLDLLDPALLRPGRFDRIVEIPPPDQGGRLTILRIHTRGLPLDRGVNLGKISNELDGLTGADIAYLVREAAYAGLRRTLPVESVLRQKSSLSKRKLQSLKVTTEDFLLALAMVHGRNAVVGNQGPSRTERMSE